MMMMITITAIRMAHIWKKKGLKEVTKDESESINKKI